MADQRATVDILAQLHGEVAKGLLAKIRSGEATAAEYAQAIKLLKDNGIEAIATPSNPLGQLAAVLPFAGRPAGLPADDDEAAA